MRARGSPDDAEAQAERIASLVFMASRGGQIVFSALMLANDRRRYDRPLLQAAALAGVVAESGWLSRRLIRARGYDDRLGVWVDCVSAATALLISHHGMGTKGGAPWAKNVAIGAAIGAASARRTTDTAGTVGTAVRCGDRDRAAGPRARRPRRWARPLCQRRGELGRHSYRVPVLRQRPSPLRPAAG